jgi:N-acetylglucosamine-6-phosphate deacetylase
MDYSIIKIFNGKVITPLRVIKEGTIIVSEGKIIEISEQNIEIGNAIEVDAKGKYIGPGFIDIHVHGGGGYDFMDGTEEAFLNVAETHAKFGTTSLVATTLTSDFDDLKGSLDAFEGAKGKNHSGSELLGLHLEGPYFSKEQRGAQDERFIHNPLPSEYMNVINSSKSILRWSAAPELKGAYEFGQYLIKKGIIAAIAHTDAIYEEVVKAVENGYSLVTHIYSGMSGVTRRNAFRNAGVIESALLIDKLDVEVIADGIHLPAPLLKLVYKVKGPERIALITDAMRAAGTGAGESILGSKKNGLKVIIEDNVAKLPDRSSFAGSVATANRLVKNMVELAEVSLNDAITMACSTPARIMGISDKKGSLITNRDADIIIFDEDFNVSTTIVKGRLIYSNSEVD